MKSRAAHVEASSPTCEALGRGRRSGPRVLCKDSSRNITGALQRAEKDPKKRGRFECSAALLSICCVMRAMAFMWVGDGAEGNSNSNGWIAERGSREQEEEESGARVERVGVPWTSLA